MKLLFLGSGSAFTVGADNFQSNMLLIDDNDNKLLIDCGSDIKFSLYQAGFSHTDITDIYISHLHSDHVGGLEYIGFSNKFASHCSKPNLYLSKDIALNLWQHTLSGGMSSIDGDIARLDTFFNVNCIERHAYFTWQKLKLYLIKVIHVNNGYYLMPSYGLFGEINDTKVFITTDTQLHLATMQKHYNSADVIFQDCETAKYPSNIHAHYNRLVQLPQKIKNKMWLYGYQPGTLPNSQQDGFLGFVKRGQIFRF